MIVGAVVMLLIAPLAADEPITPSRWAARGLLAKARLSSEIGTATGKARCTKMLEEAFVAHASPTSKDWWIANGFEFYALTFREGRSRAVITVAYDLTDPRSTVFRLREMGQEWAALWPPPELGLAQIESPSRCGMVLRIADPLTAWSVDGAD